MKFVFIFGLFLVVQDKITEDQAAGKYINSMAGNHCSLVLFMKWRSFWGEVRGEVRGEVEAWLFLA